MILSSGILLMTIATAGGCDTVAAQEPTAVATFETAPAVPLSDVSGRSAQVVTLLRGIEDSLPPLPSVIAIEKALPEKAQQVSEKADAARRELAKSPTGTALVQMDDTWSNFGKEVDDWANLLRKRSADLGDSLARLEESAEAWRKTRDQARGISMPGPVLAGITETLAAIEVTTKEVQRRHNDVLTLQQSVASLSGQIVTMRDEIKRARVEFVDRLLVRDAPPLWRRFGSVDRTAWIDLISEAATEQFESVFSFIEAQWDSILLELMGVLILGFGLRRARARAQGWVEEEPELGAIGEVFAVPFSAAMILVFVAARSLHPTAPQAVADIAGTIFLVPAFRLLKGFVPPDLHFLLYALGGFYIVDRIRSLISSAQPLETMILVLELGVAIFILARLFSTGWVTGLGGKDDDLKSRALRVAQRLSLAILCAAVAAVVLGFEEFGRLAGTGVLWSAYAVLLASAAARAATAVWIYTLRAGPLSSLRSVKNFRWLLQQRGRRAINAVAMLIWAFITLRVFGLLSPFSGAVGAVLAARFTQGNFSFGLGDLAAFAVAVWGSFLLSRFLRFVLDQDVFPRIRLKHGVPYALSTLLHYTIVVIGFLIGAAAIGFDMGRFALVAGALGVGIGFGMQDIVNNFVSGLVLLFERPLQVGDAVEVDTLTGQVKRIGIRSSTIRTWDGADVTVPNGMLVSGVVTNWTLSDRLRRIEVDVGVKYGTDPERVLHVLLDVAAAHEDILRNPEPSAFFLAFGDSSLNFRLRGWTSEHDRWMSVRSELYVRVNAALAEAGIEIPFPQRDLHLKSIDPRVTASKPDLAASTADGSTDEEPVSE
jgi:small-conductance mechanosensitive channel